MPTSAVDQVRAHDEDVRALAKWLADEDHRLITVSDIDSAGWLRFELHVFAVPPSLRKLLRGEGETAIALALQTAEEALRKVLEEALEARRVELVRQATEEARSVLREFGAEDAP